MTTLPNLRFELLGGDDWSLVARHRRSATLPLSMTLHALALAAMLVVPTLVWEALPDPGASTRVFFAEPLSVQPPPPPPPPPASAARAAAHPVVKAAPVTQTAFTAPVEVPTEIRPEEGLDLGVEGGVPGGVEGGVPGGVVGGVVGGLPTEAAPPPPVKAVRVGGDIREPRKIRNVNPVYPPLATKAQIEGLVIIEATIDTQGRVVDARILRGVPMLDEAALEAVRQWVYVPTLLSGVPTPIILTVMLNFHVRHAAGMGTRS